MNKNWVTPFAIGHAIVMILYAAHYQNFKQNKKTEQQLQQHVANLAQQVSSAEKRLTCLQNPDYIANYATHILGMQPIKPSQKKLVSLQPTNDDQCNEYNHSA